MSDVRRSLARFLSRALRLESQHSRSSTISLARRSLSLSLRQEMYMYILHCVVLHNSASRIERIFRITWKYLRHDVRPET